ncbi:Hypothetical predicted protein [Paramuricea clavata]|uniref:Uncharacterized protein n=1 Tax=Paramuricea clavata TaxID=317549 RepID=A0A6S7KX70_PARCT|nr:Hypothetical predicted protein [Paramuricea clavata]
MKSMKIAVFLVLIIAQQSYGRTRCSGYPPCRKSPIACDYAYQVCYVYCSGCSTAIFACCLGCELCSPGSNEMIKLPEALRQKYVNNLQG